MLVDCPISLGELCDKITILQIKEEKIEDRVRVSHAKKERILLEEKLKNLNLACQIDTLLDKLRAVNLELWNLEDAIRDCEALKSFDAQFVDYARKIYQTNDRRFLVKKEINESFGSEIQEVKSYKNY